VPARTRKTKDGELALVRLVEANGESRTSWDDAVLAAVKSAKVRSPIGVEVGRLWAELDGHRLSRYHATVKVAYRQAQRTQGRKTP